MAIINDVTKSLMLLVEEEVAALQLGYYPMLSRLNKKIISQKTVKWNTNVGGAGATGEATTASISAYTEDSIIGASLPIGTNRLRHSFQIQKEDRAEAASAGKGALRDLYGFEINSGLRVIMESLSGYVYTGTGLAAAGGVVGLGAVVANAAYAGIDPATYTAWSAVLNTNASNRALSADLLLAMETAIARKGGNFTAIYTTPEVVAKYKLLFAANTSINNVLPAGQADLGYTGVSYAGRPIIQDPYCPNNTLYFVNEPEVALYTFSQNNTGSTQGMQFAIEQLPSSNPDAENYAVYVKPQLKVHNRAKGVACLEKITQ
ncbi:MULTISPECIES: phage major capsid protein [Calothrix]|uniref:Phage major capsid protein n=2 Tax=Calothrix TaxID=1186 RepID=A0ABR8A9R2_9CYAN|nr:MULTISPECIES: phage major capsid protein [Calothrix]MBD2196608.1 phage major capsid protein [Calothrix parietina FACHB-288]MBD2228027.1 phage major capsid protein [Calothrix anomala FACHB-343]